MEWLAEPLQQIAMGVWQATWRSSVLIAVVLSIRAVLGPRLPPRWVYALWLVVVVRLLLPSGPASRASLFNLLPRGPAHSIPSTLMPEARALDEGRTPAPQAPGEQPGRAMVGGTPPGAGGPAGDRPGVSPVSILAWVWLAGAAALAASIAFRHWQLWRIVRFQRAVTHSAALGALEDSRARMGIGTLLGAVLTDQVQSPALFGLVRPRLLIPTRLSRHVTAHDLRYVFLHELAHLRHHDIALGWLTSFCQVLHWFNPLVWLALHRMRVDRELACDELALSRMSDADETRQYGQTLIQLQEVLGPIPPLASLAAVLEGRSQLRTRIRRIAGFGKSRPWQSVVAGVLLVLLAGTGLTDATSGVRQTGTRLVPVVSMSAEDTIDDLAHEVPVTGAGPRDAGETQAAQPGVEVPDTAGQDGPGLEEVHAADQVGAWARGLPSDLQDKVYLYYDLNRVEGKRAVDVLSTGRHGLVHGDPAPGQGIEGEALVLDGQDDFVTVEAMPGRSFTVCLWVKPDRPVPGQCRTVLILVSPEAQLEVAIDGLGQVEWRSRGGRGSQAQFGVQPQRTDPEAWTHVAAAWDEGAIRLLLNGAPVYGQVIPWDPSTQFLHVGGGSYGSWQGLIDEVVVFTEALAPDQVRQVVALAGPVEERFPAWTEALQGFWQQDAVWGSGAVEGGPGYLGEGPTQAMACSTVRQLGLCTRMITDQWAPKVVRGDWRQADEMVAPLRILAQQLDSASIAGPTPSWPDDGSPPQAWSMAPGSLARAVAVLAQTQAESTGARAVIVGMAEQVDSIIRAVGARDADSVRAGCRQFDQGYGQLVAVLGLDSDPTFESLTHPGRPAASRPPATRVRVRAPQRRGR